MKELFIGKRIFQPFFERLFRISLRGMNYGLSGMVESSGEIKIMNWINKSKKSQLILFDVGANTGQYTKLLYKHVTQNSLIYSFEPSQIAFQLLANLGDNLRIFPFNLAFSDKSGVGNLYFDTPGSAWASLNEANYTYHQKNLNKHEIVKIDTLDSFCEHNSISKIDFLKLDVEGSEISVLKGAKKLIAEKRIDVIQFEFGLASSISRILLRDFFEILAGYKIYRILQDGIFLIDYDERYEVFLTTNYLAISDSALSSLGKMR